MGQPVDKDFERVTALLAKRIYIIPVGLLVVHGLPPPLHFPAFDPPVLPLHAAP
jgi:hypothetical protein